MQQEKIPTVIIIGAGLGGLTLYHALIKNKDKKEFAVKIFERESGPKDRWQGYHIGLSNHGVQSLVNCIPPSVISNLPKASPNTVLDVEEHGISIIDHTGNLLFKPPYKTFKDVYEFSKISRGLALAVFYRDMLRDILSEGVPIQWGKKCIGYEEIQEGVWVIFEDGSREFCNILVGADGINSPVRKQKIPELQIFEFGLTQVIANVAIPKYLMDRLNKFHGNSLAKKSVGLKGDSTFMTTRIIPIEQEKSKTNSNEPRYRTTLFYTYPSELDNTELSVDDNDSASVIEHVKHMIRKTRPECELTDILLEIWDFALKTTPDDPAFKTYNPIQRRKMRDINPLSIKSWKSSRVTLLGDAAHAMSPVLAMGANNALQDAEALSQALLKPTEDYVSCIKEYEKEMIKRASADVLKARNVSLKQSVPVGYFGTIIRNSSLKIINFLLNAYSFITENFIFRS